MFRVSGLSQTSAIPKNQGYLFVGPYSRADMILGPIWGPT